MYAAILAGGVGSRLWPRSRNALPKQFADITGGGRTMIQATYDRLNGIVPTEQICVVTGERYADLVAEQLPELHVGQIITEPSGRNTAPAIALATLLLSVAEPDAVLAVLPADHYMASAQAFQDALLQAEEVASDGWLVTLGITPDAPHTGYGYIQRGARLEEYAKAYRVERFLEKPDLVTAEKLLASGDCYWNGGIFIFRVDVMLAEIERQSPELWRALMAINAADSQKEFEGAWAQMPSISIDYAIAEGAQQVAVVPLDAGWNDVGSWDALETVLARDESGNFTPEGEVLALDAAGNIVLTQKKIVALIGVDDLVIVEEEDALLIGDKREMQRVKEIVDALKAQGRDDLL